jgi:hypothetical protein
MKKIITIFSLALILGILACGTTAPLSTPEPASDTTTSSVPESSPTPKANPVPQLETTPAQTIAPPSGLQVIFIREGNLWSWTEAGGSMQLTGTGDMSTARLSGDGQLLAFMRGREVWTVNMDGTGARLLSTMAGEGAALWFAPNKSSLAVSTKDRIDVIDLANASSTPVVTYPAIADSYCPEVVWSPDASGFKTVIPPQTEKGQAELLFVFTDGTVASLAKFSMVPLSKSLPYISPDGGYIIYVVQSGDGEESLFLMDSSGAKKPYGEPAKSVRAYGWLPDSKQFVYREENPQYTYLGTIGGPPTEIQINFPMMVRWVDGEHYLALENGNLVLGDLSGGSLSIGSTVQDFDFVP